MPADNISRINTAMDVAIQAQEAGNYKVALAKARTAWMLVAAMPNSEFQDERLEWKPDSIERIVTQLQRLASSGNGSATDPNGNTVGALSQTSLIHYRRG